MLIQTDGTPWRLLVQIFQAVNLTAEIFCRYVRLKIIEALRADGQLDGSLRWQTVAV